MSSGREKKTFRFFSILFVSAKYRREKTFTSAECCPKRRFSSILLGKEKVWSSYPLSPFSYFLTLLLKRPSDSKKELLQPFFITPSLPPLPCFLPSNTYFFVRGENISDWISKAPFAPICLEFHLCRSEKILPHLYLCEQSTQNGDFGEAW